MFLEGLIVADLDNQQLLINLGVYETHKNGKLTSIKAAFMTEEQYKNSPKEVTLEDCIINPRVGYIRGIAPVYEDFNKAREAIEKAGVAHVQGYNITVVDGQVVFTPTTTATKTVTTEEGYAVRTIGYQRSGELYNDGYDGEGFYESIVDVHLIEDLEEAQDKLKHMRKEYDDGTVDFRLVKVKRTIELELVEVIV